MLKTVSSTVLPGDLPAGSILQVVQSQYSTQVASSAAPGVYVNTGLSAKITPKFATSKVLAIFTLNGMATSGVYSGMNTIYYRDASLLFGAENKSYMSGGVGGPSTISFTALDSPNSTAELTYKSMMALQTGGAGDLYAQLYSSTSTLTLIEVKA